ncbi:hypothetical protein MW887_003888 [Aspergillus wentii]|nr:hypothetical protein MW887_003888 [Aspergillus wentii]
MAPPLLLSMSRPKNVNDLIEQVKNTETHDSEKEALNALVKGMVEEFRDHPNPTYYIEASRLSEITDSTQYEDLIKVFSNVASDHSKHGKALDRDLLPAFDHCLRQHRDRSSERFLTSALGELREGLAHAMVKADPQSQYRFLYILGTVLDVAMDIHLEGIDREKIHQPLSDTLRGLRKHDDARIAQAATYAYEALHGIPNNEGPMDVFLRTSGTAISATAKIASSVASMDPGKALSAVPDILEIVGYLGKLLESLETIGKTMMDVKNAFLQDIEQLLKQSPWYSVLRFTGPLIAGHELSLSFELLKDVIPELPCCDDYRFWCGLYDQLEQRWMDEDDNAKSHIIAFVKWTFHQQSLKDIKSKDKHVQDWINLISDTFKCPQWKVQALDRRRDKYLRFLVKEKSKNSGLQRPFQHGKSTDRTGKLLEAAWKKCNEAHGLYMDAGIAQYYEKGDLLKILRLSNERLEMKNCYINLSLIETSADREKKPEVLDLRERLKIDAPSEGRDIQLQDLYKERELRNGKGIPKRILIRGRAGVGKTTLCKKIVHDFIHGKLSSWNVDRVLWIPLRKLKGKDNPEQFLIEELLSRNEDKDVLSTSLRQTIVQPKTRTLFLLDGFDEIAGEVASNNMLRALLNRDNVIVTSRPYALDPYSLNTFDLELETVGFRPDQVKEYVNHVYAEQPNLASDIHGFVKSHWLIAGLLQIPIQLDALCYTWEENPLSKKVNTMTALYQAMEVKLWRKDMVRLGKCDDNKAKDFWDRVPIENHMRDGMDLLEKFAFNGLVNNLVEFRSKEFYKTLPGKAGETDNTIKELSFLRTASEDENRAYYFIHLTFQEYFAACYFVRCWINQEPLQSISLESAQLSSLEPGKFLLQERYNGRYDIMWRFVSGLLSHQDRENLVRFMQALDSDPKDLFGPAHLRILMHCLSEISVSESNGILGELKQDLEERLLRLFLTQCKVNYSSLQLAYEMEFSEAILKDVLEKGTILQKKCSLDAIYERTQISSSLFQQMAALRVSELHWNLKTDIGWVLGRHWSVSPETVVGFLNSRDTSRTRRGIRFSLRDETELPDDILRSLISGLDDTEDSKPDWGANVLCNQRSLSAHIVAEMMPLLEHESPSIRAYAVEGLSKHQLVDRTVFHKILNLHDDRDSKVRREVVQALGYMYDCPEVLKPLGDLLTDEDEEVRQHAAESLGKQRTLPPGALENLYKMIEEDSEKYVRTAVLQAWSKHGPSELVTEKLFSMLDDDVLKDQAGSCLRRQSPLPHEIEKSLLSKLESGTQSQKHGAVSYLQNQTNLDNQTLQALLSLNDKGRLQEQAIRIIGNQTKFPDCALKPLASWAVGGGFFVQEEAINALGRHRTLPEDILELFIPLLKKGYRISMYSAGALCNQHSLPTAIIEQVISLLDSKSVADTERSAEKVLRDRQDFYLLLPSLNRNIWTALLKIWFGRSLDENLSCYRSDDCFVLNTPQQTYTIRMSTDSQRETLDYAIGELNKEQPSIPALGEEWEDSDSSSTSDEDGDSDSPTEIKEDKDSGCSSPTSISEHRDPDSRTVAAEDRGTKWISLFLAIYFFYFSMFVAFLAR